MTWGTRAGLGLGFTILLVGLPMAHIQRVAWAEPLPSDLALFLAFLPLFALAASLMRGELALSLCLFPLSHLPVLVAEPRLVGPLVYAGLDGLLAQGLVLLVAVLWIRTSLIASGRGSRMVPRGVESGELGWLMACLPWVSLGIFGAFALAVLLPSTPPESGPANLTLLVGWGVAAWVGGRWINGDIMGLVLDPELRRRRLSELLVVRRFSSTVFWTSTGVLVAMGTLVGLVYGLQP